MVQLLKWRLGWIRNANFTYLISKKLGEIFNEKIDKFEDYFIVYKEKIESLEKSCH